jgi:hypothetical protein
MLVFLDFEASSLSKQSYPIEVAWVFEDGESEEYLIRLAPLWTDWDPAAEAIHHIRRATLLADGTAHDLIAHRKHGITKQQAEDLIKKVGNDREKLNAAAAKLK